MQLSFEGEIWPEEGGFMSDKGQLVFFKGHAGLLANHFCHLVLTFPLLQNVSRLGFF